MTARASGPASTNERRFLCDEMLAGLGRWLRIAGYDTAIAGHGRPDRELVDQARREGRILLTRDRRLADIRDANDRTLVLAGDGIDAWAAELSRRLSLDWNKNPLSRCTLCNTKLQAADRRMLSRLLPRVIQSGVIQSGVFESGVIGNRSPVTVCLACGRMYWEGSHVHRIRQRLASFARQAAEDAPQAPGSTLA